MQITRECSKLRAKRQVPAIDEDGDYRVLAAESLEALDTAYRRSDRHDACVARVINNYAKGGVP